MSVFLKSIDGLNTWIGRIVGWVMILIMFITVYDVIARRVFNAPLLWAFDVSTQLFAVHFMITAAYALMLNEHASIDVFRIQFSPRMQAILELICYVIFFFPFMYVLLRFGWDFAARSWAMRETSWGAVSLPLYYIKTVIPLTAALLILQALANIVRLIGVVRTGVAQ